MISGPHCKVAPESWGIGRSKVVSSKGLEGYKMFDPVTRVDRLMLRSMVLTLREVLMKRHCVLKARQRL